MRSFVLVNQLDEPLRVVVAYNVSEVRIRIEWMTSLGARAMWIDDGGRKEGRTMPTT